MSTFDTLHPSLALSPDMTPTWQARIRDAAAAGQRLRIVGGQSKSFYGQADGDAADALSTLDHHGVVAYEPTELVVTVRAGTSLRALEALLADKGQCLAFEPPHFGDDTVGGMMAAGLSGPSRASVGAVRDFVLGAQLINGKGEALVFGGQVMKNVAGYDVSRVLAGSMGRLGVITEVSLKVLPTPPGDATLLFAMDQATALTQLAQWRSQPLPIHASCWVNDEGKPSLFVRLKGATAAVQSAAERMCAQAQGRNLSAEGLAEQVVQDWRACQDQTLPFFQAQPDKALWRLSVAATSPVLALPASASEPLVEWHGALRWVWAPLSDEAALRAAAKHAGGHATLFRLPAGHNEAMPRFEPPTPVLAAIEQRLQLAFDPQQVWAGRR